MIKCRVVIFDVIVLTCGSYDVNPDADSKSKIKLYVSYRFKVELNFISCCSTGLRCAVVSVPVFGPSSGTLTLDVSSEPRAGPVQLSARVSPGRGRADTLRPEGKAADRGALTFQVPDCFPGWSFPPKPLFPPPTRPVVSRAAAGGFLRSFELLDAH